MKRRINALKQLQVKCAHIEAKFYEEVHGLERKYAALYQPLFDKRREFVTGDVEPTDAESEWHSENEEEDKLAVSCFADERICVLTVGNRKCLSVFCLFAFLFLFFLSLM